MKIAVTGGSGFIGSHLIYYLVKEGYFVLNIDKESSNYPNEIVHDLTTGPLDLGDIDFCFHLASAAGGLLFNQKSEIIEYNSKINENIFLSCCCGSVPMVFVSTLNVFEGAKSVHQFPLNPSTPYAQSKLQGEQYFLKNVETIHIVRPCNIFGKSQIDHFSNYGESHVIPDILHKIKHEENSIEVWGDGSQKRGFLHVSDFCRCLISLLKINSNAEWNVCSSLVVTIAELIEELMRFMGKYLEVHYDPTYMQYEKMFIDDIIDELDDVGTFNSITDGLRK